MPEQPENRVVLVTGAASGIGRAIALALAAEGYAVAVADVQEDAGGDVAAEAKAGGAQALAVRVDVTDADSVAMAVERASEALGPIAVLVNCAGWDELKPFLETDEAFWRKVIAINYEGCLRVTHAVLGGMAERGYGRIVSIASDAARVGSSGEAVYAGAKAGVVAFSKTIAREHARDGVTANVVCPGPTETPLLQGMAEQAADSERLVTALSRAVPMRRLGQPQDAAAAVAFLASERAGYITGQTLSVSGGLTMA
ncbi:MAG TPA: SDR family NAD(P)-dependent oxidoreductase [Solirubrobacteraceae bacterium]|jgi:2-hydroxycyclohexanecarboxyl-CoA dehydrogenase|nr:SDR family NAD(P)-dependent oxidoreductase [Solirubrobacteraceae bacterium]